MSQDMDFKPEPPPGFFSFNSVSILSLPEALRLHGQYRGSSQAWGQSPEETSLPVLAPRPPSCLPLSQDLATLLEQIGCLKYLQVFEEQDVDLRIFLTLTESDLKEIGIT